MLPAYKFALRHAQQVTKSFHDSMDLKGPAAAWANLSAEALQEIRNAAKSSLLVRHKSLVYALVFGLVFLGYFSLSNAVVPDGSLGLRVLFMCYAMVVSFATTEGALILVRWLGGDPGGLLESLEPASARKDDCVKALKYVRDYPELSEYRDAIISQGRELLALDLDYICVRATQLAEEKLLAAARKEQTFACRELHGLTGHD